MRTFFFHNFNFSTICELTAGSQLFFVSVQFGEIQCDSFGSFICCEFQDQHSAICGIQVHRISTKTSMLTTSFGTSTILIVRKTVMIS